MTHLRLVAPELTLAGAGLLLLLLRAAGRRPPSAWSGLLAAGGCLGAGWFLLPLREEYLSALNGAVLVDSLAFYFQALLLAVAVLTLAGTPGWCRRHPHRGLVLQALVVWETAALLLLVAVGELGALYLAFAAAALIGLAMAGLTAPAPVQGSTPARSLPHTLTAGVVGAFLLYGAGFVYGLAGSTNFEEIGVRLAASGEPPVLRLAVLLFLAGPGLALAMVPFHFWVPDLVDAVPASVGAYLTVAPKLAGLAVLFRFFTTALPAQVETWTALFSAAAAVSLVFGSLAALVQTRPKPLLAYLGLAQSGYLLLGLAAISLEGLTAALFHAALYSFSSLAAFLALAVWEESSEGAPGRFPVVALVSALLSLAGVPPAAGFLGEFVLFMAAVHEGRAALAFLGVGLSVVCAYPCLRVAVTMAGTASGRPLAPVPEPGSQTTRLRTAPTTLLATGLMLVSTLALSAFPGWLLQAAEWAARRFWG
ncbi:MAG TPA: hypothetical protein GXX28_00045 [Firmicutes bacterium]|nr:hypothetical protein [Bacillota bacterium]